jgi:hypothetical protein
MNTQDTKLPPLPASPIAGEFASWCRSKGSTAKACDDANTWIRDAFNAGAAIAAQAPQPVGVGRVRFDSGEVHFHPFNRDAELSPLQDGQTLYAEPQQAQQAQGVPEAFPAEIWGLLAEVADRKGTEYTSPWEGPDGEPLQDAADAAIAWILSRAAAPQAEPQAHKSAQGCQHKRYSLDKQEQVGRCIDCGAEGRMVFVVQAPSQAEPPKSATSRDCPYCHYTGTAHCGDVADKIRTLGGDLGYCSNAQVYGKRERQDEIPDCAVEINRLRNVIQAACTGGLGHMIERWKALFPDAPVPTVHAVQAPAAEAEPQPEREPLTEELLLAAQSAITCSHADRGRRSVNSQAWNRLMAAVAAVSRGIGTKGGE